MNISIHSVLSIAWTGKMYIQNLANRFILSIKTNASMIKEYIRDGRAPIPESETTSKVMSAVRGKHTKPELALRKALREVGIQGYRLHWKKAPGRPDIAYPGSNVAIFVHGCFWHRCSYCDPPLPKSHSDFWIKKFERNKVRDLAKVYALEAEDWKVFIFWECEIRKDVIKCAEKVKTFIDGRRLPK